VSTRMTLNQVYGWVNRCAPLDTLAQ